MPSSARAACSSNMVYLKAALISKGGISATAPIDDFSPCPIVIALRLGGTSWAGGFSRRVPFLTLPAVCSVLMAESQLFPASQLEIMECFAI